MIGKSSLDQYLPIAGQEGITGPETGIDKFPITPLPKSAAASRMLLGSVQCSVLSIINHMER